MGCSNGKNVALLILNCAEESISVLLDTRSVGMNSSSGISFSRMDAASSRSG